MNAGIRGALRVLLMAMAAWLAGCDVAPTYKLSGGPINGGGGGSGTSPLDPTDPANIQAYFYLDRPVQGLLYSCDTPGRLPRSGSTDENGGFVCPRTAKVSFFVGTVDAGTLKIGSVALEIFGREEDIDARNYVAITPATLYGTTTTTTYGTGTDNDYSDYEIPNIFNLLTAMDGLHSGRQPRIQITPKVSALAGPMLITLDLNQPPLSFISDVEPVLGAIDPSNSAYPDKNPEGTEELANDGYLLQPSALVALVDRSMRRVRSGLYRSSPQFSTTSNTTSLIGTLGFLVGSEGHIVGFGESRKTVTTTGGSATAMEIFYVDRQSRVEADGDLIGGVVGNTVLGLKTDDSVAGTTRGFDFVGRLINDRVFGSFTLLENIASYIVPEYYRDNQLMSTHVGGFHYYESGTAVPDLSSDDGFWLYRVAEQLPDFDTELLPPEPYGFPRTYLLSFKGYPDGILATDAQREDPDYPVALAAHQNPNDNPSLEADGFIQITLLPNGDIVSDMDGDCSTVVELGGDYIDQNGAGNVEYLVGKIGNVFRADGPPLVEGGENVSRSYVSIMLAVYDRRHPQMGLTIGTNPISQELDPVVIDATADALDDPAEVLLLNKKCDPLETCTRPLEWFNDQRFMDEVLKPAFASGSGTGVVDSLYRNPGYYGAITSMVRVCTGI